MAEGKETKLSIVIRTVDQATAKIKAINERLDEATKPIRNFKEQLGELAEKSGLSAVAEGFKGVGEAVKETLLKFLEVGLVIGETVHLVLELVNSYDELGKKAQALGVSVDFLAAMHDAAKRAGVSTESLDSSLQQFSVNIGQARAGTGRMLKFLNEIDTSGALAKQVKGAKDNAAAFDLMAGAIAKIHDPARQAALATKAGFDAALVPLLGKGPQAIAEMRAHYLKLAGPQGEAAKKAAEVGEAMADLHDETDRVKASLVEGLSPALTEIIGQITTWLDGHQAEVKEWAEQLGKKLPGAFHMLVDAVKGAIDFITPFVDSGTKLKVILGVLAAVIIGPVVASIYSLGVAIMTTPVGWILAAIAAIAAAAYEIYEHWDAVKEFFGDLWDIIKGVFMTFLGWAKDIFLNFTPLGLIIKHWEPIKDFFVGLWDGITGVFQKAWDIIKAIVDKIGGAVSFVTDKVGDVVNFVKHPLGGLDDEVAPINLSDVSRDIVTSGSSTQTAKVTIDVNAPRGTRVSTDPKSTADVDTSLGYQMNPGGL